MNRSILFKQFILLLLFSLFTVPSLFGQYFGRNKVQYERFDFKEIDTEHYQILYYDDMRPFMPHVARMAERWYTRLSEVTGHGYIEEDRKSLIFYADDADFRQTNIVPGFIPGGVRGLAEPLRERVTMPLTPNHAVTHHVLGHEQVHSFQFDFARRAGINLNNLPLWLVEGMAEYYSLGRQHTLTSMWMRDAVINDRLPSFTELTRQMQLYNPYRFGHALLAYMGGMYGDQRTWDYLGASGVVGPAAAVDSLFDISADNLIEQWHNSLNQHYQPLLEDRDSLNEVGRIVLAEELGHGRINISPSLSPDGNLVAFLSDRIPIGIDLQVAYVEEGRVIATLDGVEEDPHLDDIRFLNSAGSWDPESRRVVFVTFAQGDNELSIWNFETGQIERNIYLRGVPALENPAWSPDGNQIAVSGVIGAISNIYVYNFEENSVNHLTNDDFSAIQPSWSPDGEYIVYVTDGGPDGTDFDLLDIKQTRLALLNVETGSRTYLAPFGETTYSNPNFSPDGESIYFIADPDGFQDIYRFDLNTEEVYRITRVQTGVTGVTEHSPALTISRETGILMFSVYSNDRFKILSLDPDTHPAELVEDLTADPGAPARVLPPFESLGENIIAGYLADPSRGLLSPETQFEEKSHTRRLSLTNVIPAQIGVGTGGPGFGTQVAGGVGFLFTDLLGDYNLGVAVQARGSFRDIGGQVSFVNRRNRVNYGAVVSHIPIAFASAFTQRDPETGEQILNRLVERIYISQAGVLNEYPLSMTRRFETNVGLSRYAFERRLQQFTLDPFGRVIDRQTESLDAPDNLYFLTTSVAYVVDFANFGFTSPIQGGRSRYEATQFLNSATFLNLLGDARRYIFLDPLTVAFRILHRGNYWAEVGDPFSTEYLGSTNSQTYIRGYSFRSFRSRECPPALDDCPTINRLIGTHIAIANMELRIPLLGVEQFGLIPFRWLPTELSFFADGGVAWSDDDPPTFRFDRDLTEDRIPVFSAGVSSRFNLFGALIIEVYYAYPFQRPERGGHFGFQFLPGW